MISRQAMYSRLLPGWRVEELELLAPAAGHDGVQSLQHRLGADVGGDLRATEWVAVEGDLHHRPEADRSWGERPAKQLGCLGMGSGGRLRPLRRVC